MHKSLLFTLFSLVLFCQQPLFGQLDSVAWKGVILEPNLHLGVIVKHTPKFLPDPGGLTSGLELVYLKQTYGREPWQALQRFPKVGASLLYMNYANPKVFGQSMALFPHLTFDLIQRKRFNIHLRVGAGFAAVTKHYNPQNNPSNNVIGSTLNNVTALRLGFNGPISPNWSWTAAGAFTHYSNASSQSPNLGINVVSGQLGLRYTPTPLRPTDYLYNKEQLPEKLRPWYTTLQLFWGRTERAAPGGPKYPVYGVMAEAGWRTGRTNRLGLGFSYEHNSGLKTFILHTNQFEASQAAYQASRFSWFISDEVFFGRISLTGHLGVYAPQTYLLPSGIYSRLGIRYYLRNPLLHAPNMAIGLYLKSHMITAEYASLNLSFSL
jgi:hypothetical protein